MSNSDVDQCVFECANNGNCDGFKFEKNLGINENTIYDNGMDEKDYDFEYRKAGMVKRGGRSLESAALGTCTHYSGAELEDHGGGPIAGLCPRGESSELLVFHQHHPIQT